MVRNRALSLALSGVLLFGAASGMACDKEDRRDVREGVNDVEEEADQLDTDGKDD